MEKSPRRGHNGKLPKGEGELQIRLASPFFAATSCYACQRYRRQALVSLRESPVWP